MREKLIIALPLSKKIRQTLSDTIFSTKKGDVNQTLEPGL